VFSIFFCHTADGGLEEFGLGYGSCLELGDDDYGGGRWGAVSAGSGKQACSGEGDLGVEITGNRFEHCCEGPGFELENKGQEYSGFGDKVARVSKSDQRVGRCRIQTRSSAH